MKPSVLAVIFLFASCTAAVPKTAVAPAAPARTSNPLTASDQPAPAGSPPAAPVFDESMLRGREFLLEGNRSEMPVRDPVLGPLGEESEIQRTANEFFHEVAEGTVNETRLVERWASYLLSWARKQKEQGFAVDSVRVGKAWKDSDGQWMVPVRLLSRDSQFQGWLFLIRDQSGIQISDVRLERAEPLAPFDPESDAQEISSPIRR